MAAFLAARSTVRHARSRLEYDDVDVRGWFFVVASEAISVGEVQIALLGVGSYVARAIQERDLAAVGWAIVAMTIAIIIYDQLLLRPMVVWADF